MNVFERVGNSLSAVDVTGEANWVRAKTKALISIDHLRTSLLFFCVLLIHLLFHRK